MVNTSTKAVEIFYSYAHEDEATLDELKRHLSGLRWEGLIVEWHDREIIAGTEWAHTINWHLNTASVIILLISPNFMASDYCYGIEMKRAMERHNAREAFVIPVILRSVDWASAPFARLQVLPTDGRPIAAWSEPDDAYVNVTTGIRKAIENLSTHIPTFINHDHRDITRFPNELISYFMSLKEYLKPSRLRFPAESDFERDLVYISEKHLSEIKKKLQEKRHALLIGPSAAGKTVLAIALARLLQDTESYKVAYKDADRAKEGEGHKWYQLIHTHDRKSILYILDNCHLAPEEVNEFCLQWQEHPPEHAQCILISRSATGEAEAHTGGIYHYIEACADETINIQSEDMYWGMIA